MSVDGSANRAERSLQRLPSGARDGNTAVQSREHTLFEDVDSSAADEELATIHVLNEDVMDIILSYLSIIELFRLSAVCRRWYNLCLQSISRVTRFSVRMFLKQLGTRRTFTSETSSVTPVVRVLSMNCGSLTTLSLDSCQSGLDAEDLARLSDMLPALVNLKIGGEFLSDDRIEAVIRDKLAHRMKCICLDETSCCDKCRYKNRNVPCYVLKTARQLNHLSIFGNWNGVQYRDCLSVLPEVLSPENPLKSVEFDCPKLHPSVMGFIISEFYSTLEYLMVRSDNLDPICGGNVLTTSMPKLNKMKIFVAYNMNYSLSEPAAHSSALSSILMLMPNLKVLDLTGNYHFSMCAHDIIGTLSFHCLLLEELNLSNCWIPADKLVRMNEMKHLKRLRLDTLSYPDVLDSVPNYDPAISFRCFVTSVLPCLKELELVSMLGVKFDEDDLVEFIDNAGRNFRCLVLSARSRDSSPPNPFQGALGNCHSLYRQTLLNIIIPDIRYLPYPHQDSPRAAARRNYSFPDCETFYNTIAPSFIRVLSRNDYDDFNDKFVSKSGYLSPNYARYIKLPCYCLLYRMC